MCSQELVVESNNSFKTAALLHLVSCPAISSSQSETILILFRDLARFSPLRYIQAPLFPDKGQQRDAHTHIHIHTAFHSSPFGKIRTYHPDPIPPPSNCDLRKDAPRIHANRYTASC